MNNNRKFTLNTNQNIIVEFTDDGFAFKSLDLEKYKFDDEGSMKLPEVPEVE